MAYATFNRFEITLRKPDWNDCSRPGQAADEPVSIVIAKPYVAKQLAAIGPDAIRAELTEYGAWDATELANDDDNRSRIIWIAAGNIREEQYQRSRR